MNPAHGLPPPEVYFSCEHQSLSSNILIMQCHVAQWSRDNHLGNGFDTKFGSTASYMWKIPNMPRDKCVLRLRYNISNESTMGGAWAADATSNVIKE